MDKVIWVDRQGNHLVTDEISDRYLINILKFVSSGRGHLWFLDENIIDSLFKEADKRNIKHDARKEEAIIHLRLRKLQEETFGDALGGF